MSAGPKPSPRGGGLSFKDLGDWFLGLGGLGGPRRSPDSDQSVDGFLSESDRALSARRVPSTSLLAKKQQVVVGMLLKYVNLTSGWRHRLFVLDGGVLRYYKVYGPTAINVFRLMETLRQDGDVFTIGAETPLLEARDKRKLQAERAQPGPYKKLPPAQGEIHLQVSSLRQSTADYRKFYIHTGTTTVALRAESKEDRWVWCEALKVSKGAWEGITPTEAGALIRDQTGRICNGDEEFMKYLEQVKQRLRSKEASEEVLTYVTDLLVQSHQKYHELLVGEENKRKALLEIIYQLEDDKRRLETAMVVEGGQQHRKVVRTHTGNSRRDSVTSAEESAASDSDERAGGLTAEDRQDSFEGFRSNADESEEEFFDCETVASVTTAHSRMASADLTNFPITGPPQPPLPEQPRPHHRHHHSVEHSATAQQAQQAQQQLDAAAAAALPPGEAASAAVGVPVGGMRRSGSTRSVAASPSQAAFATPLSVSPEKGGVLAVREPEWVAAEGPAPQRRIRLPKPAQQERGVSLWTLIKDMVGKDLTRVCLPVYFNEPLSALQKTAEELEYSHLLDEAATFLPGSVDRMLRVAAFAVSAYSGTVGRTAKPFNPLLGETYEFVCAERGFRFIAEKVVHHPTVIAAHCEGRGWVFEGDADVKSKFWGRSIELHPEGVLRVTFKGDGEVYQWNKVTTSINNLILGKIYVDHGGIMRVRNMTTGLTAKLRFKETGMIFDRDPRQVRGFLEMGNTRYERPVIFGHWDDALSAQMPDGSEVKLWQKNPPPPEPTRYHLTGFSIVLNEITSGLEKRLAPTDCRLRPDQHFLELGEYDKANAEKQRLEHKQRAARKAAERGDPIRPRWFVPQEGKKGEELAFKYSGGYWEERAAGRFTGCRDIFGQ